MNERMISHLGIRGFLVVTLSNIMIWIYFENIYQKSTYDWKTSICLVLNTCDKVHIGSFKCEDMFALCGRSGVNKNEYGSMVNLNLLLVFLVISLFISSAKIS